MASLDRADDVRAWRLRLEAELISVLAGAEAEARISRRSIFTISERGGPGGDEGIASTLLASFFGADDLTNPEQQMVWWGAENGARRIIGHPDAWAAIEALAAELTEKGTVTGRRVDRLATATAGISFPIARVLVPWSGPV